ncbi:MAG TPA: TIGR02117 family protein [Sphingomicrobium sp.]|nr:TIGR02117 family protein [Sphingomicrobium sp.]
MGEGKAKRAKRRRRRRSGAGPIALRVGAALLCIPALYLIAALFGSLVSVNRGWAETDKGITVYLADNGIHADIVMPASALGLDWAPLVPKSDTAAAPPAARWVAFGSGEEKVYLETPTWWDIRPGTIWAALTGSQRVMHVEWVRDPSYAAREIRLRPEEYRRLWAAIRADFRLGPDGRPILVEHPGYGCCDSFYWAGGRFSALSTCNTWAAHKLRLAGVETSLWPPFVQGLLWRYRKAGQST